MNLFETQQEVLSEVKARLKQDEVVQENFEEYGVNLDEIDQVPMLFEEIPVSARTEHAIIYFNPNLWEEIQRQLDDKTEIELLNLDDLVMYGTHELVHYLQQTTGERPTEGSTDDDYLDNEYEIEGFQAQVEHLSKEHGEDEAEEYVDKVLDHHGLDGKKREKKKDELMKEAGLLSYPKRLYDEMWNWILPLYAQKVYLYLQYWMKSKGDNHREFERLYKEILEADKIILSANPENYDGLNLEVKSDNFPNFDFEFSVKKQGKHYRVLYKLGMKNVKSKYVRVDNLSKMEEILDEIKSWLFDQEASLAPTIKPMDKEELENFVEQARTVQEAKKLSENSDLQLTHNDKVIGKTFRCKPADFEGFWWQHVAGYHMIQFLLYFDERIAKEENPEMKDKYWKGYYQEGAKYETLSKLVIHTNPFVIELQEFKNEIMRIKAVLRHELQHMFQDLGKRLSRDLKTKDDERYGLPSKELRDKNYDFSGNFIGNGPKNRREHALRDIEFYTDLSDAVDSFLIFNVPEQYRDLALKIFTGIVSKSEDVLKQTRDKKEYYEEIPLHPFFEVLKRRDEEKWKKAVKEFYKAVMSAEEISLPKEASSRKPQLSLPFPQEEPIRKSRKELLEELSEELENPVKERNLRQRRIYELPPGEKQNRLENLRKILDAIETAIKQKESI